MHGAAGCFSNQVPQGHFQTSQDQRTESRRTAIASRREQMLVGTGGDRRDLEWIAAYTDLAGLAQEQLDRQSRGGAHTLPDTHNSFVRVDLDENHLRGLYNTLCPMKGDLVGNAQRLCLNARYFHEASRPAGVICVSNQPTTLAA